MATRYENVIATWENSTPEADVVLDGTSYTVFEPWMLDLLKNWHNNDPVDQKEIDRNEAIFTIQGNRNPFIDHPEYVASIWGSCTGDIEAPSIPSNLLASNITETSTDLSWTGSSDNIAVTGYKIYRDGVNVITTGTNTSTTASGLAGGVTYTFYVTAIDAAGNESNTSNNAIVTTPFVDNIAPSTPSALAASNTTENSTDLSWNGSTDNVAVSGYNVYQDGLFIMTSASTSQTINGLTAGTSYSFYVTAYDAAGNESSISNSVNVTTPFVDNIAPSTPNALAASNTTEISTDLSWNASTDNVAVTGYKIYQDGVNVLTIGTNTNTTVLGLTGGTTYTFFVIAFDAAGNESNSSNSVNVTTPLVDNVAPTTPSALAASNTTEISTNLSWNESTDNVGVAGYNVYQDGLFVMTSGTTSATVNGLVAGTTYSFYVTAYDAAGNESGLSNSIDVTTMSSSGSVVLHEGYFESGWDGWQDGGSDCKRYSGANSSEGIFSIRIRDNSNISSSMTSPTFDISSYGTIDIDFSFYPKSMENNEDFWVRYHDGNSWQTIATFTRGVDFNNNVFYTANVSINSVDYTFPSNAQFRFQCDASGNNDQIYVDAVIITADAGGGSSMIASNTLEVITVENQNYEEDDNSSTVDEEIESKVVAKSALDLAPISVFPNPASNFINIDLGSTDVEITQMGIYDVMGREVVNIGKNVSDRILQKDISQLSSGMYFLRVMNSDKEVQMVKFYVEN